jgi:hypothetical protein
MAIVLWGHKLDLVFGIHYGGEAARCRPKLRAPQRPYQPTEPERFFLDAFDFSADCGIDRLLVDLPIPVRLRCPFGFLTILILEADGDWSGSRSPRTFGSSPPSRWPSGPASGVARVAFIGVRKQRDKFRFPRLQGLAQLRRHQTSRHVNVQRGSVQSKLRADAFELSL